MLDVERNCKSIVQYIVGSLDFSLEIVEQVSESTTAVNG
jgi:hypothetical protein